MEEDNEAEKELKNFCNKQYSILNKEFDEMEIKTDCRVFDRCAEYALAAPLDNDSITHKLKTKLIQQ